MGSAKQLWLIETWLEFRHEGRCNMAQVLVLLIERCLVLPSKRIWVYNQRRGRCTNSF